MKQNSFLLIAALFFVSIPMALAQKDVEKPESHKKDSTKTYSLSEVVVSASRTAQNILESPVSIENIKQPVFKNAAAPSFFDALENVKGIQMITPSLGFRIINTRGFANTTNVRFAQLVDGLDNQAPHIGAPIGNAMGPSDLDISRVEIVPGTAAALYGLNAINGLANFITKDPFLTTGVSLQQKTGINHFDEPNSDVKLFTEYSFRIAEKISDRFAFKVNATFTKGFDWIAADKTDLNPLANLGVNIEGGANNPAYDAVNDYGNESSNRRTITLQGKRYVVARTGYREQEVTDYDIQNIKLDLALHYKISPKTTLIYTNRFTEINNVYQRANRFALKDYTLQQHALELRNEMYQAKAFITSENTGKSYNLRSAAENMDRRFKSDNDWYADFTSAFTNDTTNPGTNLTQALAQARQFADMGRFQPGSAAFKQTLDALSNINNWDEGAALRVKDHLVHGEIQVNLSNILGDNFIAKSGLELQAGVDYQSYIIKPDGNYFINPTASDPFETFSYGKTGGFFQAGKSLFNGHLKLAATLRVDKNDYFDAKFNPRLSAVIIPNEKQSVRLSFQSGSRFPSIFEAYSNVNSGGVKRIGGLKVMSDGVFENAYLRSSVDRFQAAVTSDFNSGTSLEQAIQNQKGLLVKNDYTYLKPEHITAFEFGYKRLLFKKSLKVDADFYFNKYDNFVAQIEMNVANTTNTDSIPTYLNNKSLQNRYRVYTNSKSVVYNYGASIGMNYFFTEHFTIGSNASYAKLNRTDNGDGFEDGFNTPEWIGNVSLEGLRMLKNFGFNLTYKYQSGFYWRSFLANGEVKAYGTLDAQINYSFLTDKLNVKIAASNLTNRYYNSFLGAPAIGGFYYCTLTYGL